MTKWDSIKIFFLETLVLIVDLTQRDDFSVILVRPAGVVAVALDTVTEHQRGQVPTAKPNLSPDQACNEVPVPKVGINTLFVYYLGFSILDI